MSLTPFVECAASSPGVEIVFSIKTANDTQKKDHTLSNQLSLEFADEIGIYYKHVQFP